jgi:pimeloyl-ACP methyl ester carboxylesterase
VKKAWYRAFITGSIWKCSTTFTAFRFDFSKNKESAATVTAAITANTNIVLVHGAWADGSSWNKVIPILQAAGHKKVIAVQLHLHSLSDDVETIKIISNVQMNWSAEIGYTYDILNTFAFVFQITKERY